MKIAMLGSVGNINSRVIPRLVADGHQVTVISSNAARADAIQKLGATPAVGDMMDADFLTATFTGQDTVYLMISGSSDDLFASAQKLATIFANAVTAAGVHHVVNLSSIGAQDKRAGSLYAYHFIENALSELEADVAFVRPVGFYNNLFANMGSIRQNHALYSNIPGAIMRKYVAPADIADVVYAVLSATPAGKTIRYVVSDSFTGTELTDALSAALGFTVNYVEISDDQYAASLRQAGVPEGIVVPFVQSSLLQKQPEEMYADLSKHPVHDGKVKLADFAATFATAYNKDDGAARAHTVVDK